MSNKKKKSSNKSANKPKLSTYTIVLEKDKRLVAECIDVDTSDNKKLIEVSKKMIATMHKHNGVGLAHPQISTGLTNLRMFIAQLSTGKVETFINPIITDRSTNIIKSTEGCLSIKKQYTVDRSTAIEIEYYSPKAKRRITKMFSKMDAIVVQHEYNHLEGILISTKRSV